MLFTCKYIKSYQINLDRICWNESSLLRPTLKVDVRQWPVAMVWIMTAAKVRAKSLWRDEVDEDEAQDRHSFRGAVCSPVHNQNQLKVTSFMYLMHRKLFRRHIGLLFYLFSRWVATPRCMVSLFLSSWGLPHNSNHFWADCSFKRSKSLLHSPEPVAGSVLSPRSSGSFLSEHTQEVYSSRWNINKTPERTVSIGSVSQLWIKETKDPKLSRQQTLRGKPRGSQRQPH